MSVSDVEVYAECPSRWLVARRLLRDDPAGPSSQQVVGLLVHHALAELMPKRDAGPVSDQQIATTVDRGVGTLHRSVIVRPIDRARARFVVARALAGEEVALDGARVMTEVGFGRDDDPLPALEVDGVQLRGRIDRIDVAANGDAVVHDYKLGKGAVAARKLVEEGRLQVPLYWQALQRAEGFTPVAALYRPLAGDRPRGMIDAAAAPAIVGEFRTDRLEGEEIDGLVESALVETKRVVAGIRAGAVAPEPRGGVCPEWCDYRSICRVEAR